MKIKWNWIIVLALVFTLIMSSSGYVLARPSGNMVRVLIGMSRPGVTAETVNVEDIIKGYGGTVKYHYNIVPVLVAQIPEGIVPILREMRIFDFRSYLALSISFRSC